MTEGAIYLIHWQHFSVGIRPYALSPSSSLASRPLTLYAGSIDSKLKKLTRKFNPQIKRRIRRSMMMDQKIIKIITVIMICIKFQMMARFLRIKNLMRTTKKIRLWQRRIKKKARISMTSYLFLCRYLICQTTPRCILDILRLLRPPPIV
jgi:hypothetical protein